MISFLLDAHSSVSPEPSSLSSSCRVNLLSVGLRPTLQWLVNRSSFVQSAQDTRGRASFTTLSSTGKRLILVTKLSSSTLRASKCQNDKQSLFTFHRFPQNLVSHLKAMYICKQECQLYFGVLDIVCGPSSLLYECHQWLECGHK